MRCPSCGHANRAAAKFCEECGTRLASAAASAEPPRAPRDYTPRHLAEKILGSRAALEGERKQVTVLFADVKGSMDLAEQLDPEEWHRILDRFFQLLAEGVHRFEGTVNQYTGDGVMALFGAPIAHEDHARRACYAALHLAEALRRYGEELKRRLGLGFSVRMGLNSGEVVVGRIGDDLRMDYTAQGHTVGLAQRMEQLAGPERVYLTEHTAALVSGFFRLRDLGRFELKGVREPVLVYELEGLGPIRTRLEASRARGFSRFVGRDEETKALEVALARALEGAGQVVGVAGDAGVGKSRLCWELAERCRARGIRFAQGHAPPHGKMIPLLPWIDLYRSYFGITEQDDDETARDKIAGRTLRLDESLAESLPILFGRSSSSRTSTGWMGRAKRSSPRWSMSFPRHARSSSSPSGRNTARRGWRAPATSSSRSFRSVLRRSRNCSTAFSAATPRLPALPNGSVSGRAGTPSSPRRSSSHCSRPAFSAAPGELIAS